MMEYFLSEYRARRKMTRWVLFPGDHHQNSEADGGPGGHGRWRRLVWEMEDKALCAFPPGDEANVGLLLNEVSCFKQSQIRIMWIYGETNPAAFKQ